MYLYWFLLCKKIKVRSNDTILENIIGLEDGKFKLKVGEYKITISD